MLLQRLLHCKTSLLQEEIFNNDHTSLPNILDFSLEKLASSWNLTCWISYPSVNCPQTTQVSYGVTFLEFQCFFLSFSLPVIVLCGKWEGGRVGKHELIGARTGAGSLGADGWTGCGKTRLVYHSIRGASDGGCGVGGFFLSFFHLLLNFRNHTWADL